MSVARRLSNAGTLALPGAKKPASALLIWVALGSVYVIWGSTYLAIRVAIRTLPPMLMASVRFLIAGGVLYALSIRSGDRQGDRPTARHWLSATVIGGTLLLGGNGLVVLAEQHVDSGIAALLVAAVPLWIALIGFAVLRERLTRGAVIGLIVGFAGLVFLLKPSGNAHIDALGAVMVLGAGLSWSCGSLFARTAPLPARSLVSTSMEMLAGGVLLGIVGLARGEAAQFHPAKVSFSSAAATLYLIVFGSLVAFSAYAWLLRSARTSIVATYAYVNPVVAVFLGWALLNEPVRARTLIGGAIIVVGVALIVTASSGIARSVEPIGSQTDTPTPNAE